MRILSFIILTLILAGTLLAQSPHEKDLNIDCSKCHSETSWKIDKAKITFNHSETKFSLEGQHQSADCKSCHSTLIFKDADTDCQTCHKDIHQGTVGFDCARCHTPQSWLVKDMNNLHQMSRFPLLGAHLRADCVQCHSGYPNFTFEPQGTNCFDCHSADYFATQNPNHTESQFSTDCQECHNLNSLNWAADNFNHDFFPLVGGHKISTCFSCHQPGTFTGLSTDCYACHKQDYDESVNPNHIAAEFSIDCTECHDINAWSPANFDHNLTNFPLTGKHVTVDCQECHATTFTGTPTDCFACHEQDYNTANDPNHIQEGYPTDCTLCHNTNDWNDAQFDHNLTAFPLTGKHLTVDCQQCHTNGYTGTPTDCFACHEQDYNGTTDPNHLLEGYPTDCTVCHTTAGWTPSNFDHNNTNFPLTGKHLTVDCQQCHTNGYTGTPTDCFACHEQDYNGTTDPNHLLEGYPTDCTVCHTTAGWTPSNFDHNNTNFPLTGKHLTVDCQQCHTNGYTGTPTDCYACHQQDYENSVDPNHIAAGFPTTCEDCHTTSGWTPANFDHDGQYFPIYSGKHNGEWNDCADCHTNQGDFSIFSCITCHEHNQADTDNEHQGVQGYIYQSEECYACHPDGKADGAFDHQFSNFPLTGGHLSLDCIACHQNGYEGTSTICSDCHQTDFNNTTNPNHQTLGIAITCETCHTTNPGWSPALFPQHGQYFLLTGAHAQISNDCESCHNGNYNNPPNECVGCHQSDYDGAVSPNHQAAGLPTNCESCHTTTAWVPSTFSHTTTGFELTGQHALIQCSSCHQGTVTGLSSDCISCHQDDYNIAPEHVAQGYPTNCEMCHNASAWSDVTFDHQTTNFPLTGAHLTVTCSQCHANGFEGTPTNCDACHMSDYKQSINPSHLTLSLPITCETCHTTNPGWAPATFPIHNDFYQLIGAHASIANDCASCHNGDYNNTPNTCFGCHDNDFNVTNDPPHVTLNFNHDCLECHTQTAWTPASFDHNFYPISSQHNNVDCGECHSQANYQPQCLSCHLDDFNDEHDPGDPTNCWECHSTSTWDGALFDHNTTNFPLTGAHLTVTCESCHANGYSGTPTNCDACHMSDYKQSINPSHLTLSLPITCETCHTTNPGWAPATFPIHNDFYQLIGAHASIANDCASCHNGDYNNTPNTCFGCHDNDFNVTNDPPHVTLNFNHDCLECHTQTAWTPASFDHNFYPISSQHNNVDCGECHSQANYQPQCLSCHLDDFNDEHDPGDPTNCWECHSTSTWDGALFDHNTTNFPLTGAHLTVACESCHANGYSGTPTNCDACHIAVYNATQNPNHPAAGLPTNCESCHTTTAWIPSTFNHATTGFELQGVHSQIQCSSCHQGTVTGLNSDCISCHMSEFKIAPNHLTQGYPTNCEMCHNASAWSDVTFDHQTTNFPLTGAHLTTDCSQCHANGFEGTPTQCLACHKTDYSQSINPNHTVLALPTTCETCHTTNPGWAPATFPIHNDFYQLVGAHASIANDCASCHNGDYNNTPNTCFGCHDNDFNITNDPPHVTLNFNHDCLECHTQTGWTPATFNHNFFTLNNPHNNFDCSDCHSGTNYDPQCLSCHMEDFLDEHDPGDRTDCWSCHNTDDWDNRKLKIKGKQNKIQ